MLEVSFGQRILFVLTLPEDRHNPPALAVVHQLNAVDTSLKRLRIIWSVARLIGTEDVSYLAEHLCLPRCFFLVKAFLLEKWLCPSYVFINRVYT